MLTIRLFRTGKKNQPFFKIIVTEKTRPPRAGRFVEELGFYNPLTKEKRLKGDRIKYWISVGAKTSNTINNLLVSEKIIEGKKIPAHKKSKKKPVPSASAPAAQNMPNKHNALNGQKEEKPAQEAKTEA